MKRFKELIPEGGPGRVPRLKLPLRAQIVALGDVGATLLTGLRLLGADVFSEIGIYDLNRENLLRLEMEMNQIRYPGGEKLLPAVKVIGEDDLFNCDVFIFCASKGVPAVGVKGDVRMAQLEANREIVGFYADRARVKRYRGLVCMVSDPVDPLAKAFLLRSNLLPEQVRGYGLGVMNARACYFAEKEERFADYLSEGRAFGPHGEGLVIANSIDHYDDALSAELTEKVKGANFLVRELGYKPYIAPAISSAAISIIYTVTLRWHYSSIWLFDGERGAFLGMRNRLTPEGTMIEDMDLPDALYARVRAAYDSLCLIGA